MGDRHGPRVKLDLPTDVAVQTHGDWLVVKRRTEWTIDDKTYVPDTLLGTSLPAFLAGQRDFAVLFEPAERRALQHFFWSDGQLVVSILDELKDVFEVLTPSTDGWTRAKLPGLPSVGVVNVFRLDMEQSEGNGDLLASAQDPITPPTMTLIERGKATLKQAPHTFTADGLVVTRHEAVSIDGERIPYVQVGPAGETGEAPVHMTGYGGFGLDPTIRPSASFGSSAAAPASWPISAAAASSAHAGTTRDASRANPYRMMISPPWRPTSCAVA